MAETFGNSKLKVASLFCGCGGMDLGIQGGFNFLNKHYAELPFEVVYAVDNDAYATKIYNDNFSHKCETKDVREIVADEVPDHDILLGGFPCQSFSISAQNPPRLGYKDERGQLFFEMVRVLKEKQPRFFIAENVKGLLSANKRKAFPLIIKEFEKAGYHIHYKLLNASEFGVPQKRERVFIMGFRDFVDYFNFKFPLPNTLDSSKIVLKQVVDKKADKDEKWFFSQRAVDGMLRVREKMNKGRVQDLNEPCNTITSHLAKVSLNGTDPVLMVGERYRRFTPREAACIQSFPLSFKLDSVSDNRKYRAIGNAVPPVLMWNVVNALVNSCFEETIKQAILNEFQEIL
ncbi:MAG: DNA cytosine methyltransferase [Crocinitomicaceae bacterium]|nr:DNA cytosine methyltransferase [Crocinitomicaceae bacterium]